jgi:hypothetical protein
MGHTASRGAPHPISFAPGNRLGFQELAERDLTKFAAVPRHLVAAKGSLGIFFGAIDENHSGFEAGGHLICPFIARGGGRDREAFPEFYGK